MMKKLLYPIVLVGSLWATSALAADNAVIVTPGLGVTIRSVDVGAGVQAPGHALVDASGGQLGVSGAPLYVRVPSAAIASGAYASGSIGSGAIASGAVASGAFAVGAGTDGWNVTDGSKADSVCGSATGTCSTIALIKYLNTAATSSTPAGTNRVGYISDDPCTNKTKLNKQFTTNGTSSVELVAISSTTTIYVCSLAFIAAGATTVAFTTGTGTACASSNAAVIGSTTANIANSMSFAANGGMTLGNGSGTIAKGAAAGAFCMVNGTNVYVSGNMTYVQE